MQFKNTHAKANTITNQHKCFACVSVGYRDSLSWAFGPWGCDNVYYGNTDNDRKEEDNPL